MDGGLTAFYIGNIYLYLSVTINRHSDSVDTAVLELVQLQ